MAIERVPALSESLRMMVSVAVWGAQGPTITYIQEYERSLHINIRVGGVYSLPMTATGLLFCAHLPESETSPLVEFEFTDNDSSRRSFYTMDKDVFKKNVRTTKAQGFGTTRNMPIPGITAISGPVFDHTGKLQLCVAAIGPSDAISVDMDSPVVREVVEFTSKLSNDLDTPAPSISRRQSGYRGPESCRNVNKRSASLPTAHIEMCKGARSRVAVFRKTHHLSTTVLMAVTRSHLISAIAAAYFYLAAFLLSR